MPGMPKVGLSKIFGSRPPANNLDPICNSSENNSKKRSDSLTTFASNSNGASKIKTPSHTPIKALRASVIATEKINIDPSFVVTVMT